jgi:hypothetical protein
MECGEISSRVGNEQGGRCQDCNLTPSFPDLLFPANVAEKISDCLL